MFYHRKLTTVPCSPQQSLVVDQGTLVLLLKQLGQKSDHKRMKLLLPRSCVPVEVATVLTGQLRQQRLREGVTERFQLSQEWQLGSRWKSRVYTLAFELATLGIDAPPPHPRPILEAFLYSRPQMCPQQGQWREKNKPLEEILLRDDSRKAVYCRVTWLLFYVLVFSSEASGIWAPWPGIKPTPPTLEGKVLTTGQPGKSHL